MAQRRELGRAIAERLRCVGEDQEATARKPLRSVDLGGEISRGFRLPQREQGASCAEARVGGERPVGGAGSVEIGESTRSVPDTLAQPGSQERELGPTGVEGASAERAVERQESLASVPALERAERFFEAGGREQ